MESEKGINENHEDREVNDEIARAKVTEVRKRPNPAARQVEAGRRKEADPSP